MKWLPHDRKIVKGDILRTKTGGDYYYGIATGLGFGNNPNLLGGKIYVANLNMDLAEVLANKDNPDNSPENTAIFYREWGVEILEAA